MATDEVAPRAKTVSSPMRGPPLVLKNTLDPPFKLKWPQVSAAGAAILLEQLSKAFADLKPPPRPKRACPVDKRKAKHCAETTSEDAPPSKRLRPLSSEPAETPSRAVNMSSSSDGGPKRRPAEKSITVHVSLAGSSGRITTDDDVAIDAAGADTEAGAESPALTFNAGKRAQVVVGVNAVTRQLERNGLRCGLVCLSACPPLLTAHLLPLAATRGIPFAALPGLSGTASPLLGVKSALAVGIKKPSAPSLTDPTPSLADPTLSLADSTPRLADPAPEDHFSALQAALSQVAPPINIPWLTVRTSKEGGRREGEREEGRGGKGTASSDTVESAAMAALEAQPQSSSSQRADAVATTTNTVSEAASSGGQPSVADSELPTDCREKSPCAHGHSKSVETSISADSCSQIETCFALGESDSRSVSEGGAAGSSSSKVPSAEERKRGNDSQEGSGAKKRCVEGGGVTGEALETETAGGSPVGRTGVNGEAQRKHGPRSVEYFPLSIKKTVSKRKGISKKKAKK